MPVTPIAKDRQPAIKGFMRRFELPISISFTRPSAQLVVSRDDGAGLDDLNEGAAVVAAEQIVGRAGILLLRVGDGAQRQRKAVGHLLGDGQNLGLVGGQLQRRCRADHGLGAVFLFLDLLVDRENTHIVEHRLGQVLVAGLAPCAP